MHQTYSLLFALACCEISKQTPACSPYLGDTSWPGPRADEGCSKLGGGAPACGTLPVRCRAWLRWRRGAVCGRSEASSCRRQRGTITPSKTWLRALLCSLVRCSLVVALWFSCLLRFHIGGIACNGIQSCELLHRGLRPGPFPCHASPYLSCSTWGWHRTNLEFLLHSSGGGWTLPSLVKFSSWLCITYHDDNSIIMEIIYSSVRPQHLERDLGNCISHKSGISKFPEKNGLFWIEYYSLSLFMHVLFWKFIGGKGNCLIPSFAP